MSILGFFGSNHVNKTSEYHKYAPSTTDEQKKIDGIIKFKNVSSLLQLSVHGVRLTPEQVYQTMIGENDNSFIYSFNHDLMVYFLNNHENEIRMVISNMCKEICLELAKTQFAEFSKGFTVAPKAATPFYEEFIFLGNFLKNPGFKKVIAADTAYAIELCECINQLIGDISARIQDIYQKNRPLQSTTTGILEQAQFFMNEELSVIIRDIYEEAQQHDVDSIINGMIGGTQSAQKSKIIERLSETVKNFDISELPQEAKDSYDEIKSLIVDLEPHREKMNDEAILLYKKLIDERLPEILEQYIILPKKFLDLYKDNPQSPQKMVSQSLKSMENALREIHTAYFSKRMIDLQVTQAYMAEITRNT